MPGILQASTQFLGRFFLLIFALVCFMLMLSATIDMRQLQINLVKKTALENASSNINALEIFRSLYTRDVVARLRPEGIEITHDFATKKGAVPLPATLSMAIGERISENSDGMHIRLYSDFPFPWRVAESNLDDFERQALDALRSNPEQPYYRFVENNGQLFLRYAEADVMQQSCVSCHNSHPQSPKVNWQAGDVRGALEITLPVSDSGSAFAAFLQERAMIFIIQGGLFLFLVMHVVNYLKYSRSHLLQFQEKLSTSVDDLTLANEELEMFAYVASHDLKAPLRAIDNLSSWIQEDLGEALKDENKKNMTTLRARVKRMEGLLDDLLKDSLAGRNIDKIQTDLVDGKFLIEDVVSLVNPPENFTVTADKSMRDILVPEIPLNQVFQNLVGNAVKHHDRQDGNVTVSVRSKGDYHEFSVRDDGPGIPEVHHKKAFEMFQKLKRRDEVEGSGMGMALIKKIVEKFGGEVAIVAKSGRGAEIRFTWPKTTDVIISNPSH